MKPTLAGFLDFVRTTMGISTAVLPDGSPVIGMAFAVALAIVNQSLQAVAIPQFDSAGASLNGGGLTIYALAVYNLAGDNLINYASDVADAPIYKNGLPFFEYLRKQWNITGFVSGVVQSTSDDGTSMSLVVQEAAKDFTLKDLQNLKTPYGRTYLGFAQSYGPTTWGLS